MTRLEAIREALENIGDIDLMEIHNAMCESIFDDDRILHNMDEFEEFCKGSNYTDVVKACSEGSFDTYDDYFHGNPLDEITSTSNVFDVVDLYELANYIDDNGDDLGNYEIGEILDNFDEEDEEEEED